MECAVIPQHKKLCFESVPPNRAFFFKISVPGRSISDYLQVWHEIELEMSIIMYGNFICVWIIKTNVIFHWLLIKTCARDVLPYGAGKRVIWWNMTWERVNCMETNDKNVATIWIFIHLMSNFNITKECEKPSPIRDKTTNYFRVMYSSGDLSNMGPKKTRL